MALDLTLVLFASSDQWISLVLVFFTGCISFAVVAPIQMLMIQTAVGAEMIASAALQASFNIGNALGAFLGGIPLVMGYDFTSPNFVGLLMALTGAAITTGLILRMKKSKVEAVSGSRS
ncbi:MFS transport protein AraJ [compost metagenome]